MCYSAQITAAYQKLVRMTGATLSLQEFAALYAHDPGKKRPKTPKAMDDAFRAGASPAELAVWAEVEQWNRPEAGVLEQELFANRKRLADAERAAGEGNQEGPGRCADRRQQDRSRPGQAGRPEAHRTEGP